MEHLPFYFSVLLGKQNINIIQRDLSDTNASIQTPALEGEKSLCAKC